MSHATTYLPLSDVLATRLPKGDIVLLDIAAGNYYSLNETGAFIWTRCEAGRSAEQIVTEMVARYEVDLAQAEACVVELLGDLVTEKLVTEVRPA
jgi:hypothetical protein